MQILGIWNIIKNSLGLLQYNAFTTYEAIVYVLYLIGKSR